jgi:hypothetical protein
VRPRRETSMHNFSCTGGTNTDCTKTRRHTIRRTCVLHPVVSAGNVVHSCVLGAPNFDALFFVLGQDWNGFHKKHVRKSYIELLFLHPLGYVGHLVHSGASGA